MISVEGANTNSPNQPPGRRLGVRNRKTSGKSYTARQEEIIYLLVARGLSLRQVAAELIISIKTVEAHKSAIYREHNITNREELKQFAVKEGIVK